MNGLGFKMATFIFCSMIKWRGAAIGLSILNSVHLLQQTTGCHTTGMSVHYNTNIKSIASAQSWTSFRGHYGLPWATSACVHLYNVTATTMFTEVIEQICCTVIPHHQKQAQQKGCMGRGGSLMSNTTTKEILDFILHVVYYRHVVGLITNAAILYILIHML